MRTIQSIRIGMAVVIGLVFAAAGVAQVIDPSASPTEQGRAIMDAADAASRSPQSMVSQATMTIVKGDPQDPIVRQSTTSRLERSETETWTLSESTYPSRMKILTYGYSDRDDEVWLKLSSGGPKRIAGNDKQGYVQNSHLTYEDMESMALDEYTFTYLGEVSIPVGETVYPCYRVERVKIGGEESRYARSHLYLTKDGLHTLRIDMWDQNGNPHKTWRVLAMQQSQGRQTYTIATRIGVSLIDDPTTPDVDEGRNQYTIMDLTNIRVDDAAPLPAGMFRRESL